YFRTGAAVRLTRRATRGPLTDVWRLDDADHGEEVRDVVEARVGQPAIPDQVPEGGARTGRDGPVDPPLAGVVRRQRERPVAVARVEHPQVARGRARPEVG